MVYLDYSATTPVNKEVLDSFDKVCLDYPGNPNSLHKLGTRNAKLISDATEQINKILNIHDMEVIYTSGASESNNTVIKGVASKYSNRGKHIITSPFEHSSINAPLNYLANLGYDIDFVELNVDGTVNLDNLKSLIRDDTILVSISSVNSELGIRQPIEEIAKIVKEYPKCFFHSDMTQSIGKVKIDMKDIDFISFTAHKFFGLKGIGCLLKKESIVIDPLIHGGKSTSIYRSGTPSSALIVSISKALRLAYDDFDNKIKHIDELNKYLRNAIKDMDSIYINSTDKSIPQILNMSVIGIKPETMLHALEAHDIYISTQSACSTGAISKAVMALTHDEARAASSIRVSISYTTTKEEIDYFIKYFKECYNELRLKVRV